jgi:hypothetical protein
VESDGESGGSFRPDINEHSRQVAADSPNQTGDLFEHSIRSAREKEDFRKKVKKYRRDMELAECTFQPEIHPTPPHRELMVVSATREHVSQTGDVRRSGREQESVPKVRSWKPAVCEEPIVDEERIRDILSEVDAKVGR